MHTFDGGSNVAGNGLCNYLIISSNFWSFLRSLLGKICSLLVFPSSLLRNGCKSGGESRAEISASRLLGSPAPWPLKINADLPTFCPTNPRLPKVWFAKNSARPSFSKIWLCKSYFVGRVFSCSHSLFKVCLLAFKKGKGNHRWGHKKISVFREQKTEIYA